MEKIFSKCGMRCDLCLIYRSNVEKEDRRIDICNAWKKIWKGFEPDPSETICDGCCCEKEGAVLFSSTCEARKCVIEKGLIHCGYCEQYPCNIFPAEPTQEETIRKIEVEKQWTWEDEKLMEAYACKKNMDEFRRNRCKVRENTYMSIRIENFTKEHIDAVIAFEKELRQQEPDTYFWEIDEQYIRNMKNSFEDHRFADSAISLLAYQEDRVVGRIDASVVYSRFDGTVYEAYLNWICVLKEDRHKGVAQLLLQSLKSVLKEKKIDTLVILTAGNEEATKFYDTCENIEFCRGAMIHI